MFTRNKSSILFLLILVSLLILPVSCGGQKAKEKVSVVRVGVLFPLTGDLASIGKDNKNGVVLAAEEINAAGGIKALDGAKLELVFGDTQGNPDVSVQEVQRLIEEEKVVAIIGAYQSSVTKPATQEAERLETPFIVSMAVADVITERGFRYVFRICPKAKFYGRDQVRFFADLADLAGYPVQRVALLHENTDFGTSIALAQKQAAQESGMEVVIEVSYTAEGATDLSAEVAQVLAAQPDAILEATYLNDSILIARALAAANAHIPLSDAAGGTVYPEYIQQLGPLAEGTFTQIEYSKYAPGGKELNDRFQARFGADITGNSAYAYQAMLVLQDALERARTLDKEKLREALAATDLPRGPQMIMPAERLRFDAENQNESATLFMVQIQDGELVPVWPAEYATAPVRMQK
jgi:branched-chain amino acid transport system substrate-binding protein